MDQWDITENPQIIPHLHGQFTYRKGAKNVEWGKNCLFNKWWWENWITRWMRIKLDHQLIPHTNIKSKWTKNLNVRHETIKLLEENVGEIFFDIDLGDNFLALTLKAKAAKINKWDYIKLKSFLHNKGKHQQSEQETYGMRENTYRAYIW